DVTGIGEVFLQVGDIGIIRTNTVGNPGATWDDVYLGFGDENAGLMGNSFDRGSPIAEATIVVPEPAGLLLLGLAGLAIRRR
ncbi:MAG: PEP-CTERM sorting domain-containing protein, partial [Planctomycetes bacterium]|nr:PEP-CTERM sorting domain-containing protein [Planctomycetota bacterium]